MKGDASDELLGNVEDRVQKGMQSAQLNRLEACLQKFWDKGRNILLGWHPGDEGVYVLVVPHYFLGEYADRISSVYQNESSPHWAWDHISQRKHVDLQAFTEAAKHLGVEPQQIPVPFLDLADPACLDSINEIIRRYSIHYIEDRAVILFDIVDFSMHSPFHQVSQLNSLSFSLNAAQQKLADAGIKLELSRSTTGDGFYIWERSNQPGARLHLYQFMLLVLTENAVARSQARPGFVPHLRCGFHIGNHYEFHFSNSDAPSGDSFIVGDVTIDLARMLESAKSGQIFVGDFTIPVPTSDRDGAYLIEANTPRFVERVRKSMDDLWGLECGGRIVTRIQSYLTGLSGASGGESARRFRIVDKHGNSRFAYNGGVNVHLDDGSPLLLGISNEALPRQKRGKFARGLSTAMRHKKNLSFSVAED